MSIPSGFDVSTTAAWLRRIAISFSHTVSLFSSKNGPTCAMLAGPVVISDIPRYEACECSFRDHVVNPLSLAARVAIPLIERIANEGGTEMRDALLLICTLPFVDLFGIR